MNKENKQMAVGIIGLGAGGVTLFVQFIDLAIKNGKKATIHIFEKSEVARGQAYGTPDHSHILNLDVHTMSVAHTKKDDFFNWFIDTKSEWQKSYPEISENDLFPPRGIFGDYLVSVFEKYLRIAKDHGINVILHKSEVLDIGMLGNSTFSIVDDSNNSHLVDSVILAIGNLQSDNFTDLIGISGYYHSPRDAQNIDEKYPIVILGTRLTAIDTALSLAKTKASGQQIFMVSRSGSLPKIIGPAVPYELKYLNKGHITASVSTDGKLALGELWQLFRKEIEYAEDRKIDWDEIAKLNFSYPNDLEDEIGLVVKKVKRPWQSVLIAFYPLVPWVWSLLTNDDKKIFLKKYFSAWLTYLAAFPIQNAQKINKLIENKTLCIANDFHHIEYQESNKGFNVCLENGTKIFTKTLINATGSGHDLNNSKLLHNLYEKGYLNKDIAGGVMIDVKNCRVVSKKYQSINMFAIGEMTFGSWLATADLGQLSRQSEILLQELMK